MMHLDHLRYRRYVDAFVDGELDGALRSRVSSHIAECPMCDREAEMTVHIKDSLARGTGFAARAADSLRRWFGTEGI
ncbi:MAG: zf-HC2 domain-containing protein [Actinobacteria bacterium]|nr:zf-HC2 domain-containing protein [Actinomycetota bacterium]